MGNTDELIDEIQKGLLQWYDFKEKSRVLYVGNDNDVFAHMLSDKGLDVDYALLETPDDGRTFDYIVCVETLETLADPVPRLKKLRGILKSGGILLLGMNNRLGIKYFCGDKDIYTGRCLDGVEGYRRAYVKKEDVFKGRSYSMAELKEMLARSGWVHFKFYSVFPDLKNPTLIYSENVLPNEDLGNRLIPFFNHPDTAFMNELMFYEDLVANNMFHQMANAFLVECTVDGALSDVGHVTCSMDRGREKALFTIIYGSGTVKKKATYPEGIKRLESFVRHENDLAAHGISVVDAHMENDTYVMPYVKGEVAQLYLKRLIRTDRDKFLQEMDRFRDLILQSSEIVKEDAGDGEGAILRRGYLDMVPLNSFYVAGEFVFYDQEFCEENYPANAIITRMVTTFYCGNYGAGQIIPIDEMFRRYGLEDRIEHWCGMENSFLMELLNIERLSQYYGRHRLNDNIINANRQRMNYTEVEYRKIFIDIFDGLNARKLVIFGSGNFAKKFLELYKRDYPDCVVIDNNEEKWGKEIEGVAIYPPDFIRTLDKDAYKVIVCVKNYLSIIRQLESMGVERYGIYDASMGYARRRTMNAVQGNDKAAMKKYHIGYISGVFDLFHIGHLNMFKRAKEQCDYLIVGVVTDDGVRKFKKVEPFVSFEERIEMVRSCRYVDEAVEILLRYNDTKEAYKLYHFDCQFSGSDYEDDPFWIANREFLRQRGSDLVFFPYTESTSSSKIKALIEKRLM